MKNDYTQSFSPDPYNSSGKRTAMVPYIGISSCNVLLICLFVLFIGSQNLRAQYCGPNVPTFNVNLTGNPNGSWISPTVQRNDQCCGANAPDVCVQFVVTLDPASLGIIFNIYSGAVPPGALYYQINCGPPTPVGAPICLSGVGPHTITFCKPGNNQNQYIITSIGAPSVSANIALNNGCSGIIYANGYDEATLSWTSVYPGPQGTYNSYLSCTTGCDTVTVTGQPGFPPYVDYQVCGTVPCTGNVCDTVRVYFNPTLAATIVPQNPTICYGNTTTVITAVGSGGTPPYNYSWSTGATTQSINATVGTYTVTISDTSNCPPVTATVTVTAFANPITANAGPDQNVCSNSPTVQLNGTVTGANGGIWSGGSGIFSPNNTTLNATYTPTPAEIANGTVTLQLTTTGNGTCPADSDVMVIHIHTFSGTAAMTHTDVTCNGLNNGTITVSMSGGSPPYTFSWNMNPAQTSATATGLAPGTYTVTITDAFGCTGTASAAVTQPQPLSLNTAGFSTSCNGSCNGQAVCIPSGGNGNYSYNWMPGNASGASYANLCPGTYTVTVTDQLGCTASDTAIVNQPTVINISTSSVPAHCQHPDGSASANASGGVPPYTYTWTPGNQFGPNVTGLLPGNYTVTVTDFNGCTKNAPVIVGDLPGVVASITSVTNVSCANTCNGAASGNASGGNGPYAYFWNSSPPQTTINATGLCAGSYSFYVVDGNGCSSNASTNITQPLPVTITGTSAPVTICIGQGTTLSATATGGTGNYTYSWSPAGPNVSPTTTATYTVIAIDANGCTSTGQTITVTVHPPISLNATGSTVTCSGSPVQLNANANGGNGGPYNYVWMPGNLNGTSVTVSPTVTTTYTVTASDGCSPNVSMTVPVNVEQLPVVAFTANNTSGCTGACVQFTCTTPNAAAWSWNFGDGGTSNMQNPLYCYSHPGSYAVSLTVTGSNGCSASQTNNNMIVIHANPTADFAMGPQPTTILEPRICFHDLSSPDVTQWYWNFDDPNDLLTSSNQNPCHEYSDTGKYCASLIVHNQYGCWSTVTYCLVIQPYFSIYVPNAFTPNDDGLNDMFYPKGNNISPDDYHLWIYDRWGSKIFESENLNKGWDGRANGGDEIVQLGVYVWKIHVKDFEGKSHELIGSVSVIK